MTRMIAHFVDDDGQEYVVLDDPDALRNQPPPRPMPAPARTPGAPPARTTRVVPVTRPRVPRVQLEPEPVPAAQTVSILPISEPLVAKASKLVQFVELVTDGVAELIPLPDRPPAPTGEGAIDLHNQNEHRHALHSHRVLTSRVRASGQMLTKVFRLLQD